MTWVSEFDSSLATSCDHCFIENETARNISIGVDTDFKYQQLTAPENKNNLSEAVKRYFDREVSIDVAFIEGTEQKTSFIIRAEERDAALEARRKALTEHQRVKETLEIFSGKLVDVVLDDDK